MEHDGCDGCLYFARAETEEPCVRCDGGNTSGGLPDLWIPDNSETVEALRETVAAREKEVKMLKEELTIAHSDNRDLQNVITRMAMHIFS